MTFDGKAFGAEVVSAVKGFLDKEVAPIVRRLDALEKLISEMPVPRDGRDADLSEVRSMIEGLVADKVKTIEIPQLPELPELPDIGLLVEQSVSAAVAALPVPQDGKSISLDDVAPVILAEIDRKIASLPKAQDGTNGVGLAGALIDRSGDLVVTLSNGEAVKLGPVVGKDGNPGKPGTDGFNLEDFDATVMDDGRTVLLSFDRGDLAYKVELGFPVMIYRGVFKEGEYSKGDTVTWGGSLWHCDAEKTKEKPGDGSTAWTLCAKKGRDGKDGVLKEDKSATPIRVGVPAGAR